MKWVLIIVAVLVLLVLAPTVIGMMLPKGHSATRSMRLQAPPERVWTLIDATGEAASWRGDVKSVERKSDGSREVVVEVVVEVDRHGQRMEYETVESTPPTRLKRRIASKLPFGGSWTWDITPEGQGCRIRITEDGEIYNPVFRFMARFIFGYSSTIEKYLTGLGEHLGEPVTIEP